MKRRQFFQAAAAAFVAARQRALGQAGPQVPLAPTAIPQFAQSISSGLGDFEATASNEIVVSMQEFQAAMLPPAAVPGYSGTYVWGYILGTNAPAAVKPTYLGPVIVATRGTPTKVTYINALKPTTVTAVRAVKDSIDQTLHWADPLNGQLNSCAMASHLTPTPPCNGPYAGPIPVVPHLHGGEIPALLDGGPEAWFVNDTQKGPYYYSAPGNPSNGVTYRYPNTQEAAPTWFHDHALGITRLNVYAGLAGAYVQRDPANEPPNLPPVTPLVIQDRMFDSTGQLYFPAGVPFVPNPEHPLWVPEFVGDVICVNGKAWPFLNVERKRYRFVVVNGSNARAYEMFLQNQVTGAVGPAIFQIGTDGGYLDAPVRIDAASAVRRLILMPGERAEVIIDFSAFPAGTTLLLRNLARTPFPAGAAALGNTTGRIMQFRVVGGAVADSTYNPATAVKVRPSPMVRLVNAATGTPAQGITVNVRRQLTLNEVMGMPKLVGNIAYPGGPLAVLLNNTKYTGAVENSAIPNAPTEKVVEGQTELWELINITADAHPIHLHLTQFQLMNRQDIDVRKYTAAYDAAFPGGVDQISKMMVPAGVFIPAFGPPLNYDTQNADGAVGGNPAITPYLKGPVQLPPPNEAGWKDTLQVYPGQVTRLLVRYAPTDTPANTPASQAGFPFDPSGYSGYVWHCHIIDHEDNEMMRPLSVTPNPNVVRTYKQGVDY